MILIGKVDIAAPAGTVFHSITDIETLSILARRRGVVLRRTDGAPEEGMVSPGMTWDADFRFRGKDRHMDAEVTRLIAPDEMAFRAVSRGFEITVTTQVVALAAIRSRLLVTLEARPRTLGARLLLQSARLGQSGLEARFQQRIDAYGKTIEAPVRA
ncbi:MAG TPA: SRPBCC family protein [Paenirhodobacter sp.]